MVLLLDIQESGAGAAEELWRADHRRSSTAYSEEIEWHGSP
jgi:hypothetical protein